MQNILSGAFVSNFTRYGITPIMIVPSGSRADIYNFYCTNITRLFELYSALDDVSKEALLGFVLGGVSSNFSFYRYSTTNSYILNGFIPKSGDIVIDAGVCDGGSAAIFADLGCKVFAFEIDSDNFKVAQKIAKEKNFVVENRGLSDFDRKSTYSKGGAPVYGAKLNLSAKHADRFKEVSTQLTTIDSYVKEKKIQRVDFIKLNVNQSELEVIRGAANTIARFKPKLVINVYYKPTQLFEIFETLQSIRPDYEFAWRHYAEDYELYSQLFSDEIIEYIEYFNLPLRWFHPGGSRLFAR